MPVRDQEKSLENALHNQLKRSYVIDTVLSSMAHNNDGRLSYVHYGLH